MSDAVLPVETPAKKGSYFARHWRGELSLAKSWWVNGFLLWNLLVNGALFGVFTAIVTLSHPTAALAMLEAAIYYAIAIPVYIWAIVGIWRSASRYTGLALWKWWARIAICLGMVISVANIVGTFRAVQQVAAYGGTLTPGQQ